MLPRNPEQQAKMTHLCAPLWKHKLILVSPQLHVIYFWKSVIMRDIWLSPIYSIYADGRS